MLSTLTLDDQTGAAVQLMNTAPPYKREIVSVTGLYGVGALRDSRRVRPQAHGGIDETRYEDGRLVSLVGQIASTVSLADLYNEWRLVTAPMLATLDGSAANLKWTEPSGLSLQMAVRLASDIEPPLHDQASMLDYQVQFFAQDPRAYSQTLQTITGTVLSSSGGGMVFPKKFPFTFASSGGGTVSFTNGGNRPTPPIFQVYGQCVNPQIVCLDTGVRIVLNGTIPAGQYLELNAAKRTVKMGGTVGAANFYDAANSTWADMPANATSNFQLIAASFDGVARLDVQGRNANA